MKVLPSAIQGQVQGPGSDATAKIADTVPDSPPDPLVLIILVVEGVDGFEGTWP